MSGEPIPTLEVSEHICSRLAVNDWFQPYASNTGGGTRNTPGIAGGQGQELARQGAAARNQGEPKNIRRTDRRRGGSPGNHTQATVIRRRAEFNPRPIVNGEHSAMTLALRGPLTITGELYEAKDIIRRVGQTRLPANEPRRSQNRRGASDGQLPTLPLCILCGSSHPGVWTIGDPSILVQVAGGHVGKVQHAARDPRGARGLRKNDLVIVSLLLVAFVFFIMLRAT